MEVVGEEGFGSVVKEVIHVFIIIIIKIIIIIIIIRIIGHSFSFSNHSLPFTLLPLNFYSGFVFYHQSTPSSLSSSFSFSFSSNHSLPFTLFPLNLYSGLLLSRLFITNPCPPVSVFSSHRLLHLQHT